MAVPHAQPGEAIDVRRFGDTAKESQTQALFKSDQLEVLRLALPAGKTIPEHQAPGEITVHCLEGSVEFITMGSTRVLSAGALLYLRASQPHALKAIEDSIVLVTLALPQVAR